MEKWYVAAKKADFDKWAKEFHISPVTARILRNRDLTEESEIQKFLYGKLEDCYSPWLLKDMDKAVEEILKAVREGLHIRVIGDYDVDGITATSILYLYLSKAGADVKYYLPDRMTEGYGLNENAVRMLAETGSKLMVTVDTGISAVKECQLAKSLAMDVVITDHHECQEKLPETVAVVDAKQPGESYPFLYLAGCGVAYKLVQGLKDY